MTRLGIHQPTGSAQLYSPIGWLILLSLGLMAAGILYLLDLKGAVMLLLLPIGLFFIAQLTLKPRYGLFAATFLSFFISGFSRYMAFPWGLGIDIILFITWLIVFFKRFRSGDWSPLRNDLCLWALVWFGFVVLEIGNPEARSLSAWFYAMRGVGFYQLLSMTLAFLLLRHPKYLNQFLHLTISISVLGSLWGLRQKLFGTDAAEDHWLWVEGHFDEHVLFGVLRVFSFYSDAGQFGASQAMFALLCGILFLNPKFNFSTRLLYLGAALLCFIGFGISGTRGAIAVPVVGGLTFLIISKNFKLLLSGVLVMGISFYVLKYTHVLHGVEQVRRMRTALADDNPSLNARLRNQAAFGRYLKSRPLGGGIGTAGFWGNRFSPNSFLAQTPTDSYYVKIWAETGIIGLSLHLLMLGYFIGKGGFIVWNLKNISLRYKIMALYSCMVGVVFCSYGNQVFSQMPTGMLMNLTLAFIFLAPHFDRILEAEENDLDK